MPLFRSDYWTGNAPVEAAVLCVGPLPVRSSRSCSAALQERGKVHLSLTRSFWPSWFICCDTRTRTHTPPLTGDVSLHCCPTTTATATSIISLFLLTPPTLLLLRLQPWRSRRQSQTSKGSLFFFSLLCGYVFRRSQNTVPSLAHAAHRQLVNDVQLFLFNAGLFPHQSSFFFFL